MGAFTATSGATVLAYSSIALRFAALVLRLLQGCAGLDSDGLGHDQLLVGTRLCRSATFQPPDSERTRMAVLMRSRSSSVKVQPPVLQAFLMVLTVASSELLENAEPRPRRMECRCPRTAWPRWVAAARRPGPVGSPAEDSAPPPRMKSSDAPSASPSRKTSARARLTASTDRSPCSCPGSASGHGASSRPRRRSWNRPR